MASDAGRDLERPGARNGHGDRHAVVHWLGNRVHEHLPDQSFRTVRTASGRQQSRRNVRRRISPLSGARFHAIPLAQAGLITSHLFVRRQKMMKHTGSCFCGAVEVQVTGAPEGMGYCHCRSCRSWSGGPVNAFTLWKPDAVRITAGAQHVATFEKTPMSQRKYCAECGGHLMTNHPTLGLVDVFAATLPTLAFTPGVHVNYAETVLPMRDGLPKLKDFPAELGGSGEALAE